MYMKLPLATGVTTNQAGVSCLCSVWMCVYVCVSVYVRCMCTCMCVCVCGLL